MQLTLGPNQRAGLERAEVEGFVIEHPLRYDDAESGFDRAPPTLGEHNREVFRELGYSDAEIDELADQGVFGTADDED